MMLALAAKELRALFVAPLGWVIVALLQIILAWIFLARLDVFLQIQPQLSQSPNAPGATEIIVMPLFAAAAGILLMTVPLLTMRSIAEERRQQTMAFLLSSPLSMTAIVLGKFLGLMAFLLIVMALAGAMSLTLFAGGTLDVGLLLANVFGLALLSASFVAAGIWVSCLTAQPVVAAIGALALLVGLALIDFSVTDPDSPLHVFSLLRHFGNFNKGVLDTADIAFCMLFVILFLVLAIRRLHGERLRG
ncbi:MAG: ABC transporter permease [Pseudomonadota bacterium]|nr:ABC transporter permease subunit [Burkholderiales bacterium]MDQ3196245.1 ABC transporter permease [Pseudomonadota bacterium]